MRTPLSATSNFIDVLMEMDLGNDRRKANRIMGLIKYQIRMLLCFVNDLLDLRQISEGVFEIKPTVFDPNNVIQLIVDMFEP